MENEKLERKKAREWVSKGGRPKVLRRAKVTGKGFEVPTVMLAWDKAMKSGWYLASSLKTAGATELKKLYGRRFSIEETFRDIKDMRFGLSMSWTPIRAPARRDRLFLLATITHALLSMLGQAGEALGFDRTLKVNTSKRRQYSLFRQGCIWMDFIPNMKEERLHPLLSKFGEILLESKLYGYLTAFEAASK